ncbi:MAG: type II toxin-antitoxin system VapC family toxin [Chloroflexi bacterium]|nr:type II toxin-antitoxin system VapC family toxin [Chloroflexota bacterium]
MKYLLDTDTCVFWLRGRDSIRERLSIVGLQEAGVSVITIAELRYGASSAVDRDRHHQSLDGLVSGLTILGISEEVARVFGSIKADLRSQGELIEDFDILIASTAIAYRLTLVTNNTKHFERISNLSLENWALK